MAVAPSNPLRLAPEDLESIIERALEEARARGASQAEAAVSQDTGLSVGVRLGEVETLEHQRDRSMGITVYFGQRRQLDAELLKSRRFALARALAQALLFSLASLARFVEVARRHISHAISLGPVESWTRAPQTLSWR